MENAAHALVGRRLGQLDAFRAVGPRAALVGLVAANLPDVDVLLYAVNRDVGTWQHRGFTHSVLGWMSVAPVILFDAVRDGTGELVVVDLAYSSWLDPDRFRFGHRYTLGDGAVLSRTGEAAALSAGPPD